MANLSFCTDLINREVLTDLLSLSDKCSRYVDCFKRVTENFFTCSVRVWYKIPDIIRYGEDTESFKESLSITLRYKY